MHVCPGAPGKRMKRQTTSSCSHPRQTSSPHAVIHIPPRKSWPLTLKSPIVLTIPLTHTDTTPKHGLAIHVDEDKCILGDEDGTVLAFDNKADFRYMMKLPSGVKCLLPDGDFLYAGCNDGSVYDISHMIPQLACHLNDFGKVLGLAMCGGKAAVSDELGHLALVDSQGALQGRTRSSGVCGWMVCVDETGVYHGHSAGVTKYSAQLQTEEWHLGTDSPVLHGIQNGDHVYVASGAEVLKCDRATGKLLRTYNAGRGTTSTLHCLAVACGLIIAAGNKIVCYDDRSGDVVYVVDVTTKPEAMQYFRGRLFCMGLGGLQAIDLTEATVKSVLAGKELDNHISIPDAAAPAVLPLMKVTSPDDVNSCEEGKVIVECVAPAKGKKGTLKARALSQGFKANSVVRLPVELMRAGARYVVDELRPGSTSSYTAHGHIQPIVHNQSL